MFKQLLTSFKIGKGMKELVPFRPFSTTHTYYGDTKVNRPSLPPVIVAAPEMMNTHTHRNNTHTHMHIHSHTYIHTY